MSPYDSSLAYWSLYHLLIMSPYDSFWLITYSARWVMLTQLTYWSITVHLLIPLTHPPVLYLDMDPPVYKSALSIPKTSDLTWLLSRPFPLTVIFLITSQLSSWYLVPPEPSLYLLATHNPRLFLEPSCLSVLQNIKTFQKVPLSAALPSHPYHLPLTLKNRHLLPWTGLSSDPKTLPRM
jgi:hypothetical protein